MLLFSRPAILAGFFLFGLVGCASYQSRMEGVRDSLKSGQYSMAIDRLLPLAEEQNKDQLVYLMDLGTAYQMAGRFSDSNTTLLRADRLSEEVDYQSVSKLTGSLLFAEEMVQYKGDTFEKFFINANLAMNFLAMDQVDDALVEARRINEKYRKYRAEEKKNFEQNLFGLWLSGVAWEATGSYDDAYIAYKNAYDLDPYNRVVQEDLLRAAKLSRREVDYQKLKKQLNGVSETSEAYDRKKAELIILIQQGWGPLKYPMPESPRFPTLYSVFSETMAVRATVKGLSSKISERVYDVDKAAKLTLQEDYSLLVAKRIGGFVAKEVAADQIRQKDELLGFIAAVAMHASDRADLRQWSTLPSSIQVVRFYLPPGQYDLDLEGLTASQSSSGENKSWSAIELKAGQKKFLVWRTVK